LWTSEYFVRLVELPLSVEGVTIPNDDGTFDIYINSLLPPDCQEKKLQHEIRHIKRDHFYIGKDVALCEAEANGQKATGKV